MDYDVVRSNVKTAYKSFNSRDTAFYESMDGFYREGKKNPSVAKIIMKDHIINNRANVGKILAELAVLPTPGLFDPLQISARTHMYDVALTTSLKTIEAADLYKNTEYKDTDLMELGSKHRKEFDSAWNTLYPKTGKIRERIIDANRISMDKVNEKANWIEKINFAKTLSEYMQDYPKTFYSRYSLIMNNQINGEGVTPKVKNWLKRISYKLLINGKYGFKK